jgi:hypothetical protein
MIDLPPGFDPLQFASDIYQFVAPFVKISFLFTSFYLIKKICTKF